MKRKRTGFTIVELLAALGIIALMVSLLIPALNVVRNKAKETKQRAQFMTINLALEAFKNDYGDYPPSDWTPAQFTGDYCGAQKLAEALIGWDLLGFHPKSDFRSNGRNDNLDYIYDVNNPVYFDQRKGPYLELATTSAFRLGNFSAFYPGLYNNTAPLAPNTFVLCDVFGNNKVTLSNGKTAKAGAPILYYRANSSGKTIYEIYNALDNDAIVNVKQTADAKIHALADPGGNYQYFYNYILDPKITARPWPYRPDSYILISAGADGLYGTGDDVHNFGN
ncbi:MAG: type II secretion system protein [Sedimentisphaerales bacterium]|nr:type II secretion system protein [Sedimentisphaerales bacterium]